MLSMVKAGRRDLSAMTTSVAAASAAPFERTLNVSGAGLVFASWFSAALFAAYILAFYVAHLLDGRLGNWNANLPGLYAAGHPLALGAMAAHMATGAILLSLGPLQLMGAVRRRWPLLHRWTGRVYVSAAGLAGLGGLAFILLRGTIGGPVMNAGFGLYGALMVLAAVQTWRHALAGRLAAHRAWAIRLFALTIGSWLYRMEYGFWLSLTHKAGHTLDFRGAFDVVMAFFFYVPNLVVAESFIRARGAAGGGPARLAAVSLLNASTFVVALGTYYFARFEWGPAIGATLGF
jgi:hypothetical protein